MQVSVKSSGRHADMLRDAGFRATYGRVALLAALERARKPLRVEMAAKAVRGKLDLANAYRALEALRKAGLVRRVDLGHTHAHYELAEGKHHHHLVCDSCGKVADVEIQEREMERTALLATRDFKSVRAHSLEFFGLCNACA